jgi:hypothetical protein
VTFSAIEAHLMVALPLFRNLKEREKEIWGG